MELELANSSFISGTLFQTVWDSTSLGLYKVCPRKYFYSMIEQWQGRGLSPHLFFGIEYHAALELYDKLRACDESHEAALDLVVNSVLEKTFSWDSEHPKKNRDTLLRSVIWYLDNFESDPTHTIILDSGKPAVELSFKMEIDLESPNGTPYILAGHLDRLVDFAGDRYVMDRKTTGSTLGAGFFSEFSPHNQMSLYTMAARVIFSVPVAGVIIDAAQIAVGFSSFGRSITARSENQLEEWYGDTKQWIDQAGAAASRAMMPGHTAINFYPQNDTACHQYGGCPFRRVCSADPAVRRNFLETEFEKRVWNPMEERG